jgi:hypothetical protein
MERRNFLELTEGLTCSRAVDGVWAQTAMVDLGWVTARGVRFGKGGTVTPAGPQIKITQEYQAALGQTTVQVFPISPGDKLTF